MITCYNNLIELTDKYIKKQNKIYEGLIYSYDKSHLFVGLKNLGFKQNEMSIENSENGEVFILAFPVVNDWGEKFKEAIKYIENLCGWKLSSVKKYNGIPIYDKKDIEKELDKYIWLQFEPKFDIELENIPNKIYHVTPLKNLSKIKKIGLTPKSKNTLFQYESRIYFSKDVESLINLIKIFFKTNDKKTHEFVILEIKIENHMFKTRFFNDPNFKNSFYTLENIKPELIKPIMKLSLNQKGKIVNKEKMI